MNKSMSRIQKSLFYALLGSSLFWHTPLPVYAEEEAAEPVVQQPAAKEPVTAPAGGQKKDEVETQTVEVTAQRIQNIPPAFNGGQVARGANLGALGNRDFMDTPFNVTSYTAQTIEDQQADSLYDVLINDPSVRFTTSGGHVNENYTIRGLEVNYQHLYFNGMQGLAPQHHVPVEFLERVEVLKGPGSFLYGGVNASVGGAINLVPKRAGEQDVTSFTTSYTSSSHFGGHLDIGRRFGDNKEWGVRFNGLYADGDTETDGQSKKRLLGALGLDYSHDKWRLSLDAYGSQEKFDNGAVSMYTFASGYVKAPNGSTNVYKGTSGTTRNNGFLFKGEYDLRDNVIAYASFGKASANATGLINGNHVHLLQADGSAFARNVFKQYFWSDTDAAELGLRGDYQTGSIKHQLVLSSNFMDMDYSNVTNQGTPPINPATGKRDGYPTNIYNPPSLADEFNNLAWRSKGKKATETDLSSFLLADTLSFDEDKVQLTLGLRRQSVNTKNFNPANGTKLAEHDADKTLPLVGFVIKPWGKTVALYGNYIKALSPGARAADNSGYTNAGQLLAPYTSRQQEIGVKWENGDFANTLSLFEVIQPSQLVVNNTLTYDGEQERRGIEWSTFGSIAKNVRFLGGITYIRGELVRTAQSANDGNRPFGVPEWTMNAGVEWDTPWNNDLTLSVRVVYTGSQYINNANSVKIPDWVRYDIGARYQTAINDVPVTFRASVENVFDKQYWAGCFAQENYVTLGGPRIFKLSATMQL